MLAVLMIAAVFPLTASAASSGTTYTLSAQKTPAGIALTWTVPTGYVLNNAVITRKCEQVVHGLVTLEAEHQIYSGTETSFVDKAPSYEDTRLFISYHAELTVTDASGSTMAYTGDAYVSIFTPSKEAFSSASLTLNKNVSTYVGINCWNQKGYSTHTTDLWCRSSDPSALSVSETVQSDKIKITANKAGTYYITAFTYAGDRTVLKVVVPSKFKLSGSVWISDVAAPVTQLKGRDNRLSGKITSSVAIKSVKIDIMKGKNKKLTYTKKLNNKKSFDLWSIRNSIPFNKLQTGKYTFKLFVGTSKGNICLASKKFTVKTKYSTKTERAKMLFKWANLRLGDPYGQPKRGKGNYVDCSYFTQWCYRQIDRTIPGTSRSQAGYLRSKGKTFTVAADGSNLKTGDLLFFTTDGSKDPAKVWHVAIYLNGYVFEAGSGGVIESLYFSCSFAGRPGV